MEKRLEFAYGRELAAVRVAFFFALVGLLLLAAVALSPIPPEYLLLLTAVVLSYGTLFALSPFLTRHWVTRSRIILRQGWYFRAIVAMGEIVSVEAAEDVPLGRIPLGVHRPLSRPTLYVTGGRGGIVVLRLRSPRRFWQSFGLPATEIVFDVQDPKRFLEAFQERRGLLAPV